MAFVQAITTDGDRCLLECHTVDWQGFIPLSMWADYAKILQRQNSFFWQCFKETMLFLESALCAHFTAPL